MDESALDSLIDTLGGPEEGVPPSPVYTGPEVTVFHVFLFFYKIDLWNMSVVDDYYIDLVILSLLCWKEKQSLQGCILVLFSVIQKR